MTSYMLEHNDKTVIHNVHPEQACEGQKACPIHMLSLHHMRHFPQVFRDDTGLMERVCNHGIGHPDPDGLHYFRALGMDYMSIHGCDGCCRPPLQLTEYKG